MAFANKETLCWRCKRPGTRTCSWDDSKGETPVEGWTAEKVPYMNWTNNPSTTYHVIECPLFDPEENYDYRARNSFGMAEDNREPRKYVAREHVEYLIRLGWPNKAIAQMCNVQYGTVRQYRHKMKKQQEREKKK